MLTFESLSNLVTAHQLGVIATFLLVIAWCISEYFARQATWKKGAPKHPSSKRDRSTYPLIAIGIVISLVADLLGFFSGIGGYLLTYTVPLGIIVVAIGLTVRQWALRTLGKFFTMPITISKNHRIVQEGPYKWIRHPAYTGGFLTILGIALALGSALGILVTVVAGLSIYVYRINIEEAALKSRFGKEYDKYAKQTYRLFSGIY